MRSGIVVANEWNGDVPIWSDYEKFGRKDIAKISRHLTSYIRLLPPNSSVVELAAGGNNRIYYPQYFPIGQVTAVDISPGLLAINPSGSRLEADIRQPIKLPGDAFDLCVCIFAMRYLENQEEVIKEMERLIKKGAWAVIFDYDNNRNNSRGVRDFNAKQLKEFIRNNSSQTVTKKISRHIGSSLDMLAFQK